MRGVYLERLYVAVGWCVGGCEESLFYTGANEPCCGKKGKNTSAHAGAQVCVSADTSTTSQAIIYIHTHIHTRGGIHPRCTHPSLHRKPLHGDTALRDAAAMHYSPFLNMDSPVFTPFYTVCVIHRASEGKQKWQARHMDEHDACKKRK